MTSIEVDTPAPEPPPTADEPHGLQARIISNIRSGNLGSRRSSSRSAIIVLYFSVMASNFVTAVNFNNIIVQMAGTTMLAYGIVFVLLIGEIDLSIALRQRHRRRCRGASSTTGKRPRVPRGRRNGVGHPRSASRSARFRALWWRSIGVPVVRGDARRILRSGRASLNSKSIPCRA